MRSFPRSRWLAVAVALTVLALPVGAADPPSLGTPPSPAEGTAGPSPAPSSTSSPAHSSTAPLASAAAAHPVRIGRTSGPMVYAPLGQLSAQERAQLAAVRIDEALADPACTPESFGLGEADGRPAVFVCGRELLRAGPNDAIAAGLPADEVARRWMDEIRPRFAREKAALYSSRLLRSAVLGVVIPLLWLAALIATRFFYLRLRSALLHPRWHRHAIEVGGVTLLSASGVRRLLASVLAVLRWVAYFVLTYGFAVAMLRLIPTTSAYGVRLTEMVGRAAAETGAGLLGLLPRLVLLGLLALLLRASLHAVSQSFGGPLDPETVRLGTPVVRGSRTTGITIQLLLIGLFVLVAGLLLPGPPGAALLALSALLALVFLVGMRDFSADFLAGLALHYGRFVERGTRVRVGALDGVVVSDGPFALTLRTDDGALVRVPYRALARVPLEFDARPLKPAPTDRPDGTDDAA